MTVCACHRCSISGNPVADGRRLAVDTARLILTGGSLAVAAERTSKVRRFEAASQPVAPDATGDCQMHTRMLAVRDLADYWLRAADGASEDRAHALGITVTMLRSEHDYQTRHADRQGR